MPISYPSFVVVEYDRFPLPYASLQDRSSIHSTMRISISQPPIHCYNKEKESHEPVFNCTRAFVPTQRAPTICDTKVCSSKRSLTPRLAAVSHLASHVLLDESNDRSKLALAGNLQQESPTAVYELTLTLVVKAR